MDVTTSVTIITLGTAAIGAAVSLIKHFKNVDWEEDVKQIKKDIEEHKSLTINKLHELEHKVTLLSMDAIKIEEIKTWVSRLERSIDAETTKLEDKIDKLVQLILDRKE